MKEGRGGRAARRASGAYLVTRDPECTHASAFKVQINSHAQNLSSPSPSAAYRHIFVLCVLWSLVSDLSLQRDFREIEQDIASLER
jgi:hypothetical protein